MTARPGSSSTDTAEVKPADLSLSVPVAVGLQVFLDVSTIVVTGMLCWLLILAVWKGTLGWERYLAGSTMVGLTTAALCSWSRLYAFEVVSNCTGHLARLATPLLKAFAFFVVVTFSLGHVDLAFSRIWTYVFFFTAEGAFLLERYVTSQVIKTLARQGRVARNMVIVGAGQSAEMLVQSLAALNSPWVRILGMFDDRVERFNPPGTECPVLGDISQLANYARNHRIDDIFITLPWTAETRLNQVFDQMRQVPANVHLVPEVSSVWLQQGRFVKYFGVNVLNVATKPIEGWNYIVKGLEDKIVASAMLLVLTPVMLVAAIAIRIESRGPILFRQNRLGFNNTLIKVYKFRTMYHEARDENADRLTTRGDPRVTRVGRILRRTSIDELPQLFNVLQGQMSLVGPRPHALSAKAAGRLYGEVVEHYADRHKIKPGITGMAQVNGLRGETDTEEKIKLRVEYDIFYMENWSLILDFRIMIQTLYTIFNDEGAY